jgi:hypothetical protein
MTVVFARQMSSGLTSLVQEINKQVAASEGKTGAFVVFLPGDKEALKPKLEEFAAQNNVTVPLTIAESYDDVARKFKVKAADDMPVNVLVYRNKEVSKAFTFNDLKAADVQSVQAAIVENSK